MRALLSVLDVHQVPAVANIHPGGISVAQLTFCAIPEFVGTIRATPQSLGNR